MSEIGRCFGLHLFEKFFRKIAIFRNFDHWSEILSMSAGRPISQGVCPPLVERTTLNEKIREPNKQWSLVTYSAAVHTQTHIVERPTLMLMLNVIQATLFRMPN